MEAYLLLNKVNGMKYVGVTSQTLRNRWLRHLSCAKRHVYATLLHDAIREHGEHAFEVISLSAFDTYDAMLVAEKQLIVTHACLAPQGYNMTIGGQGTQGYKWSEEDKANLSAKKKGYDMSRAIEASVKVTTGKPLSAEHRAKISAAHKGKTQKPSSPETRAKIAAAGRGRKVSDATRAKISEAATKRWQEKGRKADMSSFASSRSRGQDGTFI